MRIKLKRGQLLMEVMITIGLLAIFFVGVIPMFMVQTKAFSENWRRTTAKLLVKQAAEVVKAIKIEDWNNIYRPPGEVRDGAGQTGPYHVIESSGKWALATGAESINLNNVNFSREIRFNKVSREPDAFGSLAETYVAAKEDPSIQKITVTVSTGGGASEVESFYLSRWQNEVYTETTWQGQSGTQVDTTQAGTLRLAQASSGISNFGNEYYATSTPALYRLNNSAYRTSMRFTARQTGDVSSIYFYINARSGNGPTYRYGIQTDNGGNPSGNWLAYTNVSIYNSTGWKTVNFTTPASLTENTVYHLVSQWNSGTSPGTNRYIEQRASLPSVKIFPVDDLSDPNANTLRSTNSGTTWTTLNQEPIYLLGYTDNTYQGNPFDTRASRAVYGANFEGETFSLTSNKTVAGVGVMLATSTTTAPADSLYVYLKNVTDNQIMIDQEEFMAPAADTNFSWKNHDLSTPQTLEANHQYQIYFSSPASNATNYYNFSLSTDTPNSAPYNDLTWNGANSFDIRSTDSGSSFTDTNSGDLSYYLQVSGIRYYTSGTLVSTTLDTTKTNGAGFNRLSFCGRGLSDPTCESGYSGGLPANVTVRFQLAANNDNTTWNFVGPSGTAADYYELSSGTNIWTNFSINANRYLKYKVYLATTDESTTPVLDWAKINWAR